MKNRRSIKLPAKYEAEIRADIERLERRIRNHMAYEALEPEAAIEDDIGTALLDQPVDPTRVGDIVIIVAEEHTRAFAFGRKQAVA